MGVWVAKSNNESQIYFTADESLVAVDISKLLSLVHDLDQMAMPSKQGQKPILSRILSDDPDKVRWVLKNGKAKGQYIPGEIWIHPDLSVIKMKIIMVLTGKRRKVTQQMIAAKP